jgi:hypothetical protein
MTESIQFLLILCGLTAISASAQVGAGEHRRLLEYAPAPVDNPLKGLVPYQSDARAHFPHSMEFNYVPYSALVKGYETFDWKPLDAMLDDIASRGHQAVVRVFLEYPGKEGVIPDFLLKDGLAVTTWRYDASKPLRDTVVHTPNYEDRRLRDSLKTFIAAFGKKYDGDPRLGFVTAGLLGIWGEWHTYPKHELFASKDVQRGVMDAYEKAFRTTPVLLRYPTGEGGDKESNADRKFGYHDDSFAWATLDTGEKGTDWYFMSALKAAGPNAQVKWKTHPIGGEIRPEAWGEVFDAKPKNKNIQNFRRCVEATRVTWLMDSGMFQKDQSPERVRHAEDEVRRMGYEFHASAATIGEVRDGKISVSVEINNRGVAPFYYTWKAEWGLLSAGVPITSFPGSGDLIGLLPDDMPRVWSETLSVGTLSAGRYTLAVRVPNAMKGGKPVRFANKAQDPGEPGWLLLGEVVVP